MGIGDPTDEGGGPAESAPQPGAHVEAGRSIVLAVVARRRHGRRVYAEAVARLAADAAALGPASLP